LGNASFWSAAACRRFRAGSWLPAAAASRGRESGAEAPHSKSVLRRAALIAVALRVRLRVGLALRAALLFHLLALAPLLLSLLLGD